MTVPSQVSRSGPYNGNGVTVNFEYKFKIVDEKHLVVIKRRTDGVDVTMTRGTHYTVSGVGATGGGHITMVTPPAVGEKITIIRDVPFTQETDLQNQGPYYAETVEDALDLATMRDQQINDNFYRTLKVPIGESVDMTIPPINDRANRYLSFDSEGRPIVTTYDVAEAQRAADRAVHYSVVAEDAASRSNDDADRSEEAADRAGLYADEAKQQIANFYPDVVRFSGDGLETEFDLGRPLLDERMTNVFIDGVYQQKDTYEIVAGVLTFSEAPPLGVDNIEVNISATSAQAFAIPGNNTVTHEKTDGSFPSYRLASDARSLGVNGTLTSGGFTGVRSAGQERDASFAKPAVFPQAMRDVGTCLIIPPSEESTNFVGTSSPWMTYIGPTFRAIPVDVRTILYDTPISIPLFKPVKTNGWGWLVWEYIGDEPMYVNIQGSLDVAVRTSALTADAWSRLILRLRQWDTPALDDGQGRGRHLATSLGALTTPQKFRDYREFNDWCAPVDQSAIDNAASFPNLFVGSDNGFFETDDTTEALRTSDSLGVVPSEVKTTKWIDLQTYTPDDRAYIFTFDGTSSVGRMQYKMPNGTIRTYDPMNQELSAQRIYRVPVGARWVRIFYSGRGDSVSNENFRPLGLNGSAARDPVKGFWDRRLFNVNRDVVFWPGAKYALEFFTTVYDGANAVDWGFRYQGGGFSFLFDATSMRRALSKKLYRG